MEEAGIQDMKTYVARHLNTVSQYIDTMPTVDLCLAVERHLGTRVLKWWWYQEFLELEGIQKDSHEAELEEREREKAG